MGMKYAYEAPSAAENFVRGHFLGVDLANSVVRLLQPEDKFAGFVLETHDRTAKSEGVLTHTQQDGTIAVGVGLVEMRAKTGFEPVFLENVYQSDLLTDEFTNRPGGVFLGINMGPWVDHAGWFLIDTTTAFARIPNLGMDVAILSTSRALSDNDNAKVLGIGADALTLTLHLPGDRFSVSIVKMFGVALGTFTISGSVNDGSTSVATTLLAAEVGERFDLQWSPVAPSIQFFGQAVSGTWVVT